MAGDVLRSANRELQEQEEKKEYKNHIDENENMVMGLFKKEQSEMREW